VKKNGFATFIILVIVIVLGAIGYLGYKNLTKSPTIQSTVDTSNWKTFNSSYGYSIEYPSGWTIAAPGGANPKIFYDPILNSPCNYDNGDLCVQIFISSTPYGPAADHNYAYSVIDESNKFAPDFIIGSSDKTSNKINFKVDGDDALGFEYFQANTKWQYVVVFDHNSTRYTITYEEQQKGQSVIMPKDWKDKNILDTMLSTFKFTK